MPSRPVLLIKSKIPSLTTPFSHAILLTNSTEPLKSNKIQTLKQQGEPPMLPLQIPKPEDFMERIVKLKLSHPKYLLLTDQELIDWIIKEEAEKATKKEAEAQKQGQDRKTGAKIVGLREAQEIFNEDFLGPEEVEQTWGALPEAIPDISASREELERAKEMDQMLTLRINRTKDGRLMSLEAMNDILGKRWEEEKKGGLLNMANGWKLWIGEDRFKRATPRSGWALVSKGLLPESTSENYIDQTGVIIKALGEIFRDIEIPEEYEEAIQ